MTAFKWDDGGRASAGFVGTANDCVVRAISIATEVPYKDVYDAINRIAKTERITASRTSRSNSRTGVYRCTYEKYLRSINWRWTPTMAIGVGCRVHLRSDELPSGRLILSLSKHVAAVVDGVLHDLEDCSRYGTRCVYGYWSKG